MISKCFSRLSEDVRQLLQYVMVLSQLLVNDGLVIHGQHGLHHCIDFRYQISNYESQLRIPVTSSSTERFVYH